jgi:hypothetical protein
MPKRPSINPSLEDHIPRAAIERTFVWFGRNRRLAKDFAAFVALPPSDKTMSRRGQLGG